MQSVGSKLLSIKHLIQTKLMRLTFQMLTHNLMFITRECHANSFTSSSLTNNVLKTWLSSFSFSQLLLSSIYLTVVEFDEEDEVSNPQPQGVKCQREFMQQQQLRGCKQWICKRAQQGRIGYEAHDFELTLEDNDENPMPQHQPALQMCCNELKQVARMCVCPTLKMVAHQVRIQGMHGQQQVQHIFQTAQNLPNICNIPSVGSCQFQQSRY